MRRALAALFAATLAAAASAQHVFVEVHGPERAFVGQPVTFVVRVDYDADWFEAHGVATTRQPLPLPVHLDVPWLRGASDRAVTWRVPRDDEPAMPVAVGDRVVPAWSVGEQTRDGRALRRFELRARWLPRAAGTSSVEPVTLRYEHAEQWTDDLLRGRQPVSQQRARVASQPRTLQVVALPQPAPDAFTGAVGAFTVDATSGGERVRVGDSFQVEVTIAGDGNVAEFGGLRAPALDGFHVQGVVERGGDDVGSRTFALDVLALRAGVTEVPGVPFVAFSPAAADYVEVRGPAVPVLVDAAPDAELPPRVRALVEADRARRSLDRAVPWWAWVLGGFVLYGAGRATLRMRRARQLRAEQQRALARLREVSWQDAQAVADAFAACVAQSPGDDDVASIVAQLEAARFGGEMPARDEVLRLASGARDE